MTIAADARVIESVSLKTAEAALTGESAPIDKLDSPVAADAGVADRTDMLYAGTAAVYGRGRAVVVATGMHTEFGRIAGLLQATQPEPTPLQRELDRLGKILGAIVIVIAVVVGATILLMQRDITTAVLVGVLLYTVSLAVSAVPEGLAAVTTVVLSLGMQRMAKRNAIVRRLSAVETLGSATVICTDKTGTLTQNEMTVRALVTASGPRRLDRQRLRAGGRAAGRRRPDGPRRAATEARRLLAAAVRSPTTPSSCCAKAAGAWSAIRPRARCKVAARKAGLAPERLAARFARIGEIPFSSERKLMSTAHADAHASTASACCSSRARRTCCSRAARTSASAPPSRRSPTARRAAIQAASMRSPARRCARWGSPIAALPADDGDALDEATEQTLVWLGVVGMIDPPRRRGARRGAPPRTRAGVRVLMITGDHPRCRDRDRARAGHRAARTTPARDRRRRSPRWTTRRCATRCRAIARLRARRRPSTSSRIVRALQAQRRRSSR